MCTLVVDGTTFCAILAQCQTIPPRLSVKRLLAIFGCAAYKTNHVLIFGLKDAIVHLSKELSFANDDGTVDNIVKMFDQQQSTNTSISEEHHSKTVTILSRNQKISFLLCPFFLTWRQRTLFFLTWRQRTPFHDSSRSKQQQQVQLVVDATRAHIYPEEAIE